MRVQLACLSLRGFRLLTPRKTLKVITLKHLITKFSKLRNMKDNYIVIGLSGATNAGKTTLCENLKEDFPDAHVINMDDYFVEEGDQRLNMVPEVNHANWEELCAIEFDKLHKDVINWIDTHKESNNNKPAVLIVEGFILFNYKPLVPVFHKKYFLTITKDKCWERRKHRHYIPPDPPGYFDFVVWPMYLKNKEELANIRDIEYLYGAEDRKVIYEKVRKDIAALVKPV